MKNIFKDKLFWLFALLVAGFIFLAAINDDKTYQAKVRILFLPRNEVTARNINQILENAKQLPLSLSFYDKMVELNSDIEDSAAELPLSKRKEYWNEKIEISQIEKSGVVEFVIFDDNQAQAEIIANQVGKSVLTVMGNYYEAKTNLEMRLIDGPVVDRGARIDYTQITAMAISIGLVASLVINLLINLMVVAFNGKREEDGATGIVVTSAETPKIAFPEIGNAEKTDDKNKKNIFDFRVEDEVALVAPKKFGFFSAREKKASAPSNLPIAEEFDLKIASENVAGNDGLKEMTESVSMKKEEEEFILDMGGNGSVNKANGQDAAMEVSGENREATPEEVKMRLNKLLGKK